ncbi:MAG: LemA family protein [Gammaproteobacteria bacterium]|nr:LemA family protein [Gammaproteobacteria bacterium]
MTSWIVVASITVVVLVVLYNRLVRSRNRVDTAWSDIDVQLQRRHDLVPQLVSAVQAYTKYERATLDAVTQLRAEAMKTTAVEKRGELEEELSGGVARLLALAEEYPDLKANENFAQLQEQLVETEDYLQFARRYYNGSVRDYNTMTETVPSNFVARWFHFSARQFFQITSDQAARVPQVEIGSAQ